MHFTPFYRFSLKSKVEIKLFAVHSPAILPINLIA